MDKNMNQVGASALTALFFIIVFLFFCCFFINIHPLTPFFHDDWVGMSKMRWALPDASEWNPLQKCFQKS